MGWRGLRRLARQRAVRLGVPDVPDRPRADASSRASTASARSCGSGPPTSSAAIPRSTPARRRTCGRSPRAPTWRCSDPTGSPSSGTGSCSARATRPAGWTSCPASGLPRSAPVLQGVRGRLLGHRPDGRRGQPGAARAGHLRRPRPAEQYPELGQSALFCVTEVHTKADIDRLGRRARGGARDDPAPIPPGELERADPARALDPGERGIIPPAVEPEMLTPNGRSAGADLPPRCAALAGAGAARAQPAARAAPLPAALPGDARQRRQRPPRPRDLHDEVQPEGQRGAGPLAQGRRPAPAAGRRHRAGHARGPAPLRADAVRDLGPAPLHLPAGRRIAGRVRERAHHARLPRRPRRRPSATRSSRRSSRTRATAPGRRPPATR